jgi:hypothetical protein
MAQLARRANDFVFFFQAATGGEASFAMNLGGVSQSTFAEV